MVKKIQNTYCEEKLLMQRLYRICKIINETNHVSIRFFNEFVHHLNWLFSDVIFENKHVLDVGAGKGLLSFYAAIKGAKSVLALEPEASGADKNTANILKSLRNEFAFEQIEYLPDTFQVFKANRCFDIALFNDSINHLDEEACIKLHIDCLARDKYIAYFRKVFNLLNNKGQIIIADASRYNFFAFLRIKNPFAPDIEWRKHQSSHMWIKLLKEAGFTNPSIRWTSYGFKFFAKLPFSGDFLDLLRLIARIVFGNRIVAYFIYSRFIIIMQKQTI